MKTCLLAALVASVVPSAYGFQAGHTTTLLPVTHYRTTIWRSACSSTLMAATNDEGDSVTEPGAAADSATSDAEGTEKKTYDTRVMEMFLNQKYPAFMQLLSNQQIWNELRNGEGGYTIFAANNKVFDKLGDKKIRQLNDPRNLETTEKIGRYHAIAAPVTSKQIFDEQTGGVKTLGGEVPIGKTKSGGFLGFGGEEDGGVTVNGAKILESFEVTNCIVHEVDGLVSPELLWRYMDQLRIPGT